MGNEYERLQSDFNVVMVSVSACDLAAFLSSDRETFVGSSLQERNERTTDEPNLMTVSTVRTGSGLAGRHGGFGLL